MQLHCSSGIWTSVAKYDVDVRVVYFEDIYQGDSSAVWGIVQQQQLAKLIWFEATVNGSFFVTLSRFHGARVWSLIASLSGKRPHFLDPCYPVGINAGTLQAAFSYRSEWL